MKPLPRPRKVVLQALKSNLQGSRTSNTPQEAPPRKFIIRSKKQQEKQRFIQSEQQDYGRTPVKVNETNNDEQKLQNLAYYTPQTQHLQARDRKTLLKYQFKQKRYDLQRQKNALNQWLGEMHFAVVSSSFNLYLNQQLTFQQVKVHCCQNLLLNILNFLTYLVQKTQKPQNYTSSLSNINKATLSNQQLTKILKQINHILFKNLQYMLIKYPLTKDTKPNKALKSLIYQINNLGHDQFDMVSRSNVQFKLKQQDNYTSQIMSFLNFLMQKQSQLCKITGKNFKQLTYYQYFYETIQTIFTSVYYPQKQDGSQQNKVQQDPVVLLGNIFGSIGNRINGQNKPQDIQKKTKQQKQYKQKVLSYTHYLIGKKISSNTELYSPQQIKTQIFDVRNSSILRILTKWTEELENKILNADKEILKRPFRFKKTKQGQYSKLSAHQKNDLYLQTTKKAKQVKQYNQELKQNYNQIQAMLCSHLNQNIQNKNIPKSQYKVGEFCTKIQTAASSTLLSFLNKVIHLLLRIPAQLKQKNKNDQQYKSKMDISLVTFKISDLFRCKIKSRQAQIVRIFKQIKRISQKGTPFKIVRIKDRLSLGTKDILINILFMNIFLCQIQLGIQQQIQNKQQSYDSFSHFLYQLHRSRLGPIMQSACTWAQFDQRSKIYRNFQKKKIYQITGQVYHNCPRQKLIANNYPFVCSWCKRFYSSQQGLLKHKKCMKCKQYYQCSKCLFSRMKPEEISKMLDLNQRLGQVINDFKLWTTQMSKNKQTPKFGLIISKKMKKPSIIFFQTVLFRYDAYIINIEQDNSQQSDDCAKVNIIYKIQGNLWKNWKRFCQSYIVYEWLQKRLTNKTITPGAMRQAIQLQKQKYEQQKQKAQQARQNRKKLLEQKKKKKDNKDGEYKNNDTNDNNKNNDKASGVQNNEYKNEKVIQNVKQNNQQQQQHQQNIMIQKYHYNIAKQTQNNKVRVIQKIKDNIKHIYVLGIFLNESTIRNKLKSMMNKDILKNINKQKLQVIFLQDQFIFNQLDLDSNNNLNQNQIQQCKQTLERVSQVYLDNNFIQYLDIFKYMPNLKVAHLSHNNISNLIYLQNLHLLSELVLQDNLIYSIQGLQNKPQLVQLNLNQNNLSNLQFFSKFTNNQYSKLKILQVNHNQIQKLNGLQNLVNLKKLDLYCNLIDIIQTKEKLNFLQELEISSNKLVSLKGIQNFPSLQKLYANKNKIKKISSKITCLQKLQILQLSNNKIKKIQNLSNRQKIPAKNLLILNLKSNKIQKMQGFDRMRKLKQLYLNNNRIRNIQNYMDLTSLQILDLSHNCLQDIKQFYQIQKDLGSLTKFIVNSNIQLESHHVQLSQLQSSFKRTKISHGKQN